MLHLYNSLTRQEEPFAPLNGNTVRMYACGPTVYARPHIGNFRTFLFFDLVHRYLDWSGYEVRFVMNLTDVDDKTIEGASEAGKDVREYTAPFTESILADALTLGILPPRSYPLATAYVPQMVSWIARLEKKGLAYAMEDGCVYFSIGAFPAYGRLKGLDPESTRPGARVADDEYEKENVRDFALWKARVPEDGEVFWGSPWGEGRPGWHIECSAMSMELLGPNFDLHLGGEDLVFPHQANIRIIKATARYAGLPMEKVFVNVDRYGNMSSATIPVAMDEAIEEGRLEPGMNLLLVAFGAGLTWGAMAVRW